MQSAKRILNLGLVVAFGLAAADRADAVMVLKQVQVSDGNQVELQFDREVDVKSIKTEFYQNIIQLSLNNVAVYPPKIFSVDGSDVSKVFAYQYTPKLVRCRLTVKGKAEDFKSRISLRSKGRILTLTFGGAPAAKDKLTIQAAKALSAPQTPARKVDKDPASAAPAGLLRPEDRSVLEKVMNSGAKHESANEAPAAKAPTTRLTGQGSASPAEKPARVANPGSSSMSRVIRTFAWMTVVLILLAGALVALRKFLKSKSGSKTWLKRMMKGKFGASGQLIEVEATHYLGPKKSIAVVKVQGRRLVLGITDESINLITQLGDADGAGSEADIIAGLTGSSPASAPTVSRPATDSRRMGTGATAAGAGRFADILASADAKPSFQTPENTQRNTSVRDQIRKRVEGMKNL